MLFLQDDTPKLIWTFLMMLLGTVVPALMFLEENISIRIFAVFLFTVFHIGAIATVNLGRPEVRVFDRLKGEYRIHNPNHIFTWLFRRSRVHVADLERITGVKLLSFKAKRWDMRWIGPGDDKYRHQELKTYENYRLFLDTQSGEHINIYDWYDLDHAIETGEKIAD